MYMVEIEKKALIQILGINTNKKKMGIVASLLNFNKSTHVTKNTPLGSLM